MTTPEVKILSEEEIAKRQEVRQRNIHHFFVPNRAVRLVHYAEGLYRDLMKEAEESEATIRELQKQLEAAMTERQELGGILRKMMTGVKENDATPTYEYRGKGAIRPYDGTKPEGGGRWLTPREIVQVWEMDPLIRGLLAETNGNTERGEK